MRLSVAVYKRERRRAQNTKRRNISLANFSKSSPHSMQIYSVKHNPAESITNRSTAYQWRLPNLIHPRALLAKLCLVPANGQSNDSGITLR